MVWTGLLLLESTYKTRDFKTLRSTNPSDPPSCITLRTVPCRLIIKYFPHALLSIVRISAAATDPIYYSVVVLLKYLISKSGIPWIRWPPLASADVTMRAWRSDFFRPNNSSLLQFCPRTAVCLVDCSLVCSTVQTHSERTKWCCLYSSAGPWYALFVPQAHAHSPCLSCFPCTFLPS